MQQRRYLLLSIIVALSCSQPVPRPAADQIAEAHLPQIRIEVISDQSRSIREARIAKVTPESFAPAFERLRKSGGELAVGFIRDRSNLPFLRLRIPPPPALPAARPLPANIFAAAAAQKDNDAERDRCDTLLRVWRKGADQDIAAFKTAIAPLLARDNDAPATDIRSVVIRSNVFIAEPRPYAEPPKNVVVFVSDGFENVSREELPQLEGSPEVLLVNGTGSTGALGVLHPRRFESLDSALRFAVREGDSRVHPN